MNLLQLIQKVAGRTGVPIPTYIVGNPDPQVVQLLGLLEEQLDYIVQRGGWQVLTQETTFVTSSGEDQGAISTLAPNGFRSILNDTITNRTLQSPVFGPLPAPIWQRLKMVNNSGPFNSYRIVRGKLLFSPGATAGQTCAFEYLSEWAVLAVDGITYRRYPTVDTDGFLLPDNLLLLALRWKWKSEKGLDYAEDFRSFEECLNNALARDGTKPILSMDNSSSQYSPGIFVSPGNWNLP